MSFPLYISVVCINVFSPYCCQHWDIVELLKIWDEKVKWQGHRYALNREHWYILCSALRLNYHSSVLMQNWWGVLGRVSDLHGKGRFREMEPLVKICTASCSQIIAPCFSISPKWRWPLFWILVKNGNQGVFFGQNCHSLERMDLEDCFLVSNLPWCYILYTFHQSTVYYANRQNIYSAI